MRTSLLVLALALSGCPGTIDEPDLFTGNATCDIVAPYYIAHTCITGCHSADRAEGELDLETEPLRDRLIGAKGHDAGCDTYDLIKPDAPEESLLYMKLGIDGSPPCGNAMPLFGRPAHGRQLECMIEWLSGNITPAEE